MENTTVMRIGNAVFVLSLALIAHNATAANDQSTNQSLTVEVDDEFSADSRAAYQIEGSVDWSNGTLLLSANASVTREFEGSPWAEFEIVSSGIHPADKTPQQLDIWLLRKGTGKLRLTLRRQPRSDGAVTEITLREGKESEGQSAETLIRETVLTNASVDHLRVECRYGLVLVSTDEQILFAGKVEDGNAPVAGISLESESQITVDRLAVSTARSEYREYTDEEIQQTERASAFDQQLIAAYRERRLDEAVEHGKAALEIRETVLGKNHPSYATSLVNLAVMYQSRGDHQEAIPLYRQAMENEVAILGEQHPNYATSLHNLAALYTQMGDDARAEPLFQKALQIRRLVLGDRSHDYASSLNSLGLLYERVGDYERAEPLSRESADVARALLGDSHPDYATSLNNLGMLYDSMAQFDKAEPLYREAADIQRIAYGEMHPSYADSLNNLAVLYVKTAQFSLAEPLYVQARDIWKATLGPMHTRYAIGLNNLAKLYLLTGDLQQAEALSAKAVAIAQQKLAISSVVQSERQQKSNQRLERDFLDWLITISVESRADAGELARVIWQWKGSVTRRQRAYRQTAKNPAVVDAFELLRQVSGQLSSISDRSPIPPPASGSAEARQVYEQDRSAWLEEFARLNEEREQLEQQIAAESAEFRRFQTPLTAEVVGSLLPPRAALVDFFEYEHATRDPESPGQTVAERRFVAVIVRRDDPPQVLSLGRARNIAAEIAAWRAYVAGASDDYKTAMSARDSLRQQLWAPVEEHLSGIDMVILSPDTILGTLPFAALPGKLSGSYLIEDYRIVSVPFANLLNSDDQQPAPRTSQNRLLVVGDVDYDQRAETNTAASRSQSTALTEELRQFGQSRSGGQRQWRSLPGFQNELDAVVSAHRRRFRDQSTVTALTGDGATERAFSLAAADNGVLHLITHGFFTRDGVRSVSQHDLTVPEDPPSGNGQLDVIRRWLPGLLSGLVLAGANKSADDSFESEDGILRASEIAALSQQGVDLVVLSACETGLGAVAGGEGLTGLQRAFHIAGAHSVIASLWKVDDRATQELMRRFYENLWQKNMSKIDALHEAQLWMLRHPKELEAMGVTGASTRGLGTTPEEIDPTKEQDPAATHTAPYFWAAFQLSGDWR